jgi:N4-gp56 family major capsid protein
MANITTTETAAVGIDVVSRYVQMYLAKRAILIPSVTDLTGDAVPGVKSVSVGRRSGFTAVPKVANAAAASQAFTWTSDALALDQHKVVFARLENIADVQATIEQAPEIMAASTQAIVDALEAAVYTALATTKTSAPDHRVKYATASTLSTSDIIEARRLLSVQNVPFDNRFLAIHPNQEADLLKLEDFLDVSKYGSNVALLNGEIGRLLGFTVLVSNNVTADTSLAYHRSHVAFARQQITTFTSMPNLEYVATDFLMQALYGVKTLDAGVRGVLFNDTGA